MGLTGGTRATVAAAAAAMLAGLIALLDGILRGDLTRSVGGTCLTLVAVTFIALIFIRHWVLNASDERRMLAAALHEASEERTRYIALQAALECEQGRLNRDMASERRRIATQLIAEREAIRQDFEEQRATLITETMEATFRMFHKGKFAPKSSEQGRLIQFPGQEQPAEHPQRDRSREHGVVGP